MIKRCLPHNFNGRRLAQSRFQTKLHPDKSTSQPRLPLWRLQLWRLLPVWFRLGCKLYPLPLNLAVTVWAALRLSSAFGFIPTEVALIRMSESWRLCWISFGESEPATIFLLAVFSSSLANSLLVLGFGSKLRVHRLP